MQKSNVINMGSVKGYEGEWVLMDGKKIIAHSTNMKKILKIAEKYPDDERYVITKIFSANASFY
jgi:hypothetical protein